MERIIVCCSLTTFALFLLLLLLRFYVVDFYSIRVTCLLYVCSLRKISRQNHERCLSSFIFTNWCNRSTHNPHMKSITVWERMPYIFKRYTHKHSILTVNAGLFFFVSLPFCITTHLFVLFGQTFHRIWNMIFHCMLFILAWGFSSKCIYIIITKLTR